MTDDKYANAVDVVAKNALTSTGSDDCGPVWEDYPDIGENDWADIVSRVQDLLMILAPNPDEFAAAYEYLAARAREDSHD